MEITVKIQHNDDMRSITLISPTGDTLRLFSEEVIDFFHGVEQSHKHGVMQAEGSDGAKEAAVGKERKAKGVSDGYKEKYEKCIKVIKRFDAGIIGMYDL